MSEQNEYSLTPPPTWAEIINRKLIDAEPHGRFVAVDWNFMRSCISRWVGVVCVDEDWYLRKYQDVYDAVSNRIFISGKQHYTQVGFYESRFPYEIIVDEEFYYSAYPDVRAACQEGGSQSAQEHFELFGFREGRLPYRGFHLLLANDAKPHFPPNNTINT